MAAANRRRRFETAEANGVTVVKFEDPILDEKNCWIIKEQVYALAREEDRKDLLLDFGNVRFLSSAALGALLTLNNRVLALGGRLGLCRLDPSIREVMQATKLDRILDLR
jgi:anti-sigma B factor antagonist